VDEVTQARVVVIGGGITGLTAAYRLTGGRAGGPPLDVTLLEASSRPGGKLRTDDVGGLQVEVGPDSFVVRKPAAVELCTELGLGEDLIVPGASGAFVWARGRLVEFPPGSAFGVPSGVGTILRWPGLSGRGRLAAALDLWRRDRPGPHEADESAGALVSRRLGAEAADALVLPVLAGIHAADPDRMSVAATFPELQTWERAYGSLVRGARSARRAASRAAAPGAMFATLDGGLERLPRALAAATDAATLTATPAERVLRAADATGRAASYVVAAGGRRLLADAVVIALPAAQAAHLVDGLAPAAAGELRALRTASTATVTLVYPPGTAGHLPEATGCLMPARTHADAPRPRVITACTWISRKWPDQSFGDRAVIRCFAGRDGEQAALDMDDRSLAAAVAADVELITPMGSAPLATHVTRWPDGMPQYDVGHLERVARIEADLAASAPGVFLAGAPYRGVGIADCVRQGNAAAEAVSGHLSRTADRRGGFPPDGRTEEAAWRT